MAVNSLRSLGLILCCPIFGEFNKEFDASTVRHPASTDRQTVIAPGARHCVFGRVVIFRTVRIKIYLPLENRGVQKMHAVFANV